MEPLKKNWFMDYFSRLKDKIFGSANDFKLKGANLFNSFDVREQMAIIDIYKEKASRGEFSEIKCVAQGIESVAQLYQAQKCAFQDVLVKEGFDLADKVDHDYTGRIAALTEYGTFLIMGKNKDYGRFVTMSRICLPHLLAKFDRQRSFLFNNPTLGEKVRLGVIKTSELYQSSPLHALAISPHGADGDELEAAENMALTIMLVYCLSNQRIEVTKKPELF